MSPKTNVLAICGVPFERVAPPDDGWFYSDFLLLNACFAGASNSTDRWYTAADPTKVLARHKVSEYLQGNPWLDRKVVLSKNVDKTQNFIVKPINDLKNAFLADLRVTAASASQNGEQILLVLVGHGEDDSRNFGFRIGGKTHQLLLQSEIQKILQPYPELSITIILTSCYSGGWVNPQMTVMTAADGEHMSYSNPHRTASNSIRFCGGIYTTVLLAKLAQDLEMDPDDRDYEKWTGEMKTLMAYMDHKPEDFNICFSAQNSEWGNHWISMVKLPVAELRARLDSLPTHKSSETDNFWCDRSSLKMKEDLGRPEKTGSIGSFGSRGQGTVIRKAMDCRTGGQSHSAMRNIVRVEARNYLSSNPGPDNMSANTFLNGNARHCLTDVDMPLETLETLLSGLLYRLDANKSAITVLETMDVQPVSAFDKFTTEDYISLTKKVKNSAKKMITEANLIPDPDSTEGSTYPKPYEFIAASLIASDNYETHKVEAKIALVVKKRDELAELKRNALRIALDPSSNNTRIDWRETMHAFVNKRITLPFKKAEETVRTMSPGALTNLFRKMSVDRKNKSGHRSRHSRDAGHGSGDQGHQLPF